MSKSNPRSSVSAQELSRSLAANRLLTTEFGRFLSSLRERRGWHTAGKIVTDPLVRQTVPQGSADSFRRTCDRLCTGRFAASETTLDTLSKIFFRDASDPAAALAETFSQWASSNSSRGKPATLFSRQNDVWTLNDGVVLTGANSSYAIIGPIPSATSRGLSYEAQDLMRGTRCFVKTLRLKTRAAPHDVESEVKRFERFFHRERNNLMALDKLSYDAHVARLIDFGRIGLDVGLSHSIAVPFLVQQFLEGRNLSCFCKEDDRFRVRPDEWQGLARQVFELLGQIHDAALIHGDIEPANLLWYRSRVYLVDFGEAAISSAAESVPAERQQLRTNRPFAAPERQGDPTRPLDVREDLYGAAATLVWAGSGKDPTELNLAQQDGPHNYGIRDWVAENIRHLSGDNEGVVALLSRCLHARPEERPQSADSVLAQLRAFDKMAGNAANIRSSPSLRQEAELLITTVESVGRDSFFHSVLEQDLRDMLRRVRDMAMIGRCDISGPRDSIISGVLNYLAALNQGDLYLTLTCPSFWNRRNLGVNGRFMTANKMLAARGVTIRRLFAIGPDDVDSNHSSRLQELLEILQAQREVVHSLQDKDATIAIADKRLAGDGYFVGVKEFSKNKERDEAIASGRHIGIIRTGQQYLSLSFEEVDGVISKATIWQIKDREIIKTRVREMERWLKESLPVGDYIGTLLGRMKQHRDALP